MRPALNKTLPDQKRRQWDAKYQAAFDGGDKARRKLALSLADAANHDPGRERAGARPDQRSFCLHNQGITPQ